MLRLSNVVAPSIPVPTNTTIVYVASRCKRGKVRHDSEESAELAGLQLEAREKAEGTAKLGRKLKHYWCPEHSAWHVGHKRCAVPLADLRTEVLKLYDDGRRSKAMWREVRLTFDDLARSGLTTAGGLDERFIDHFVATAPDRWSSMTLAGKLRIIRIIAGHCVRQGYCKRSPFETRKLTSWVKAVPLPRVRHYSREEIRRLLDQLAAEVEAKTGWPQWKARRTRALVALAAYCGPRASECYRLRVADVDLANRAIMIRGTKTAGSCAPIGVPLALTPILRDWLEHRLSRPPGFKLFDEASPWMFPSSCGKAPWTSGAPGTKPRDRLQAACERAGLPRMTFQGLRRSWATHAEFAGVNSEMIRRNLRHTSTRTSEVWYREADLANLREAVEMFDF